MNAIGRGSLAADEIEPALCSSGLPPGRYDIEVELYVGVDVSRDEAERHSYHIDRSAQVLAWKGIARTIEVGGAAADLLEPFDSEQAVRSIKQSLEPQFCVDDRSRPWLVMFRYCCHIGQGARIGRSRESPRCYEMMSWPHGAPLFIPWYRRA